MRPPLIEALDLAMCDVSSAVRVANKISLGAELKHLKQDLGYEGGGTYWSFRDKFKPGERLTWPSYCVAVAGISEATAKNFYRCGEAVKVRLRCRPRPGTETLLRQMEMRPSTMKAAEREAMLKALITLGLSTGDTQQKLLREYKEGRAIVPETTHAKNGESGNAEPRISLKELYERYPDKDDANEYAMAKLQGMDEETAKKFVAVMGVLRWRRGLGFESFQS